MGKIPPVKLLVPSRYPWLLKAEIAQISANKFCPENLYKLRHDWERTGGVLKEDWKMAGWGRSIVVY